MLDPMGLGLSISSKGGKTIIGNDEACLALTTEQLLGMYLLIGKYIRDSVDKRQNNEEQPNG